MMTTKPARRSTKPHFSTNRRRRDYPLRQSEGVWAEIAKRTAIEEGGLSIEGYPFGYLMRSLSDLLMARKVVVGRVGVVLVALNEDQKVLAACDVPPLDLGSDWDPGMFAAIGKLLAASSVILGIRQGSLDLTLSETTRDLISSIEKAVKALGIELHDVVAYNGEAVAGGVWTRGVAKRPSAGLAPLHDRVRYLLKQLHLDDTASLRQVRAVLNDPEDRAGVQPVAAS